MRIIITQLLILTVFLTPLIAPGAPAKKPKKAKMEKVAPVGEKPTISFLEPRGIERGIPTKIKIVGTNFLELTELKLQNPKLKGEILDDQAKKPTEAWIKVTPEKDLPRGAYDLSLVNKKGESAKVKLYVDDLPQVTETDRSKEVYFTKLPSTFWGGLEPMGDADEIEFQAQAGQNLVFDLAAKSIGSKANTMIILFDDAGIPLARNNVFDGGDPLLTYKITRNGRYKVRVSEETMNGSPDHFYRLSIGELPVAVGVFPLSVATNAEARVELVGYNLPEKSDVIFKAEKAGDIEAPIDEERFRSRRPFKVLATDTSEMLEAEPNDSPGEATRIKVPGAVNGRIWPLAKNQRDDFDLFRFAARKGETLVVETMAMRRSSPVDTKIEILHPDGKPVERLLLQAVRDSYVTFRPIDSNTADPRVENWEEMELNQYLYMQGEVTRIFRMPQGPDSGFQLYSDGGKRLAYFNTSTTAHALEEPCYIVEPHPPGTKLMANGLPVFPLYYANDDDGDRKLGSDSKILFSPETGGDFLIRVSDSRGYFGERCAYRLAVREAKQDFKVTLNNANPTVPAGGGQEFSISAERIDGFGEEIVVEITGLPSGFLVSTPLVIQAGHLAANGTINAATNAVAPSAEAMAKIKVVASAMVNGKKVTKDVNPLKLNVAEKPKLFVAIEPYVESETNFVERSISEKPFEITIAPGQIVPAWLKIKRNGHEELVTFTVESLPHGVTVDNIGLNGVLIPKGENDRQIFLKAAKWVPEIDRLCYCQAKQAGNPTSLPLLIHVRKQTPQQSASVSR